MLSFIQVKYTMIIRSDSVECFFSENFLNATHIQFIDIWYHFVICNYFIHRSVININLYVLFFEKNNIIRQLVVHRKKQNHIDEWKNRIDIWNLWNWIFFIPPKLIWNPNQAQRMARVWKRFQYSLKISMNELLTRRQYYFYDRQCVAVSYFVSMSKIHG